MKLLLDQNLSPRLVASLEIEFPESCHVRDVDLASASDEEIWTYAANEDFSILTKDSDFQHRSLLRGFPPKVIQLRLGNSSTEVIISRLRSATPAIHDFLSDPEESLLIIDQVFLAQNT